ncbi:Ig-like domain-containing protein [Mycolicibacterium grossiae]|nr:Ig-like domain-containing protein [Mycolicibacterium grossiae]
MNHALSTGARPGVWAARELLDDGPPGAERRRHAIKVTTSYARYVGRVGALAVSLGVGMAIATNPGLAHADTDADSDSSGGTAASSGASGGSATGAGKDSTVTGPTSAGGTASTSQTSTATASVGTSSSSASGGSSADGSAVGSNDVPAMNVSSSGGAHTSTHGTGAAGAATDGAASAGPTTGGTSGTSADPADAVDPASAEAAPVEPVTETPVEPATDTPAEPVDAPVASTEVTSPQPATHGSDGPPQATATPEHVDTAAPQSVSPTAVNRADEPAAHAATRSTATDMAATGSAPTTFALSTAVTPQAVPALPTDPISALLAVPGAVVNMFTGFVGSLLSPFLYPGPGAPAQLPSLWAVLAWVRREITHTFFNRSPVAVPVQTGQSLTGVVTGNLNAIDPNGDPLTATVTTQGQFGTVVINGNGTYTYTPNAPVPAGGIVDSFQITITDGPDMHLPGIFGLVQNVFECIARFVGLAQPDTIVKTVPVTVVGSAIGLPPVVVTTVVGPVVTPNSGPVVLDSGLLVTDVDSPTMSGATVKIGVGYTQGDVLAYTPIAGNPITATWDATNGVLVLSGEATAAQYQAALRSVTFASTAATLVGAKAVLIAVTDKQNLTSLPALVAVTMLGVNAPPLVVTVPVGPVVTAGSPPNPLNPLLTVVDLDSSTLTGATVTIGAGFTPGDTLSYAPLTGNPIVAAYDAATGTLTLSGEATVAQYQAALRAVTFGTSSTALIGLRTVSITATDALDGTSLPGLVAVTVLGLPGSIPSVVATTPVKLYTAGGTPVVLDANLTIVDADSTTATKAVLRLDPLTYVAGTDRLAFADTAAITGSWDAQAGTLTLTGVASVAAYQAALRSVTFASDALVGVKTVSVTVTADGVTSLPGLVAVTVASLPVPTNLPSVVATTPVKLYTAGGTPVVLDANVTLVDADSLTATGATVRIDALGYAPGSDRLAFADTATITGTWNATTGTLTLTGAASIAAYQAALRSVTFASDAPIGVKTVSITVTADGVTSLPGLIGVTVAALPVPSSAPSVVATTPVKLYTSGGTAVVLDAAVTIVDVDSANATKATVTIGGYVNDADTLAYSGPLQSSWDAATGVLTLSGTASVAQYQAALRSVTFASTSPVGLRTVSIVVTADDVPSVPGLVAVTIAALPGNGNLPAVVATTPVKLYTGGGTPSVLDANVTLVDADSTAATGATVRIGGYDAVTDRLAFANTATISGTWDAATGTLTLTGDASLAEYQAALRSVTFASDALAGVRTVSIVLTADGVTSLPGLIGVTVAALPVPSSAPGVVATTPVKLYTAGGTPVVLDANVTLLDPDSTTAGGATVRIDGYDAATDRLAFANTAAITGTWDAATGTLTLTGDASLAEYQAALRSVTFASDALVGVKTVSMTVAADGVTSLAGVIAVTVAALPVLGNLRPVVATTPVKLYTSGGTPAVLDANLVLADADSTTASGATLRIGGYDAVTDRLAFSDTATITGTWDAATGTLTLTGDASLAEYQAALRAVTFASDALAGVKTVSITVTADGQTSLPGLVAVTVAALPVPGNLPSVVATTPVKLYTAGGTPVVLDANVTLLDPDSTTAGGATVRIDGYDAATDRLAFANTAAITGTWDAATGTLTLTGDASLAEYQAALRSVTFASDALVGVKTVSMTVAADGVTSLAGVIAVTVAALPVLGNLRPVVATTPVKLYTSGGTPAVLDANLVLADADSTTASGATLRIGGYDGVTDRLAFSDTATITGTWDAATGTLTLSGTASLAEYQAALRSVTFASDALAGVKTVSITVTADGETSVPGLVAVTVAALPVPSSAPSVVATTPVKLYTSGGQPVVLDGTVTLIDVDSGTVTKATVTIGGYVNGDDALNYSGPLTKTWDAQTGTLTLTGAGTLADYQAALRSVTFASTASVGVKTVSIVVTADGVQSAPGLVAVTVAALPMSGNLPSVVATTPVKLYTAGGAPVTLDGNVTIVDADSTTVSQAAMTIGGYVAGVDRLGYTGPLTGTWDAASGTLTLTGAGTVADYQAALRSVTFASDAPAGVRTVSIVVTADGVPSAPGLVAVTVAALPVPSSAPGVVATTPVKLYTSGGQPVVLDGTVTIVDVDSTSVTKATVTIAGYSNGVDTLAYSGPLTKAWDAQTGTLTLTGAGTLADYQAALRSVTFASTASVGVKTVSIVVTADGVDSAPGLVAVTVAALPVSGNLPSVVATTPVKLYTGGGAPVTLDANVTIVDADSTTATGAIVRFDPLTYSQLTDRLSFVDTASISGTWNGQAGVLTLTGTASVAEYQAALRSVTLSSTALVGVRTVTIVLTADGVDSAAGAIAVTVAALPVPTTAPPVVATTPVKLYTAGGAPVVLDANVTVLDADSPTATKATVTVTAGYDPARDALAFTDTGSITGSWDAQTGVLTLSGTATIAEYQAALRSVTFASDALAAAKTVSIVVTAGGAASAAGVVAVTVATLPALTSAPGVVATTPVKLYTSGGQPVVLDGTVTIVDVDSTGVTKATVTIGTGYANGSDVLNYSGPLTKTWDATTGTLTLTGAGTVADYQAALRSVTFSSTAPAGVKSVAIVVTADGVDSLPGVVAVTVAALPVSGNLPGVVATTPVKLYTSGGAPSVLDANVTLVDADSTTATGATVTVTAGYDPTRDRLAFADTGSITGSWDAQTGVLTLSGAATIAQYQAALRTVTFASDALAGAKTVAIEVRADGVGSTMGVVAVTVASLPATGNLATIVATTPVKLYTAGGQPVVLDGTVTLVDADSTGVTKATMTIGAGYATGVDVLTYSGPLTGTWDAGTGTLTLTGAGTVADYQAALRTVTFSSTAPAGLKTVTIVVTADGVDSLPGAVAVTVASLPVPANTPSLVATTPVKLYTSGGAPVVLDGSVLIVDVDSDTVTKATLTIGGYVAGDDVLAYTGPLTGTWDAATGTLTLSGTASVAEYQAALRSVTFASEASTGVKTVSITVTADGMTSVPGLVAVTVATLPAAANLPSVVATTPVKLYTGGGAPVALDANVTVVDADSATAGGATVRIDGYDAATDRLAFADTAAITGTWDAATGVLTLTGTASLADYQAALRSVTFASDALAGLKTVTIVLTANGVPSLPGVVAVTVASLPVPGSAPSVVATTPVKLYTSGGTPTVLDGAVTIIDVDSTGVTTATVTIGAGYANGVDVLDYWGPLTKTWDAATGTLTLTGAGTVADYQAALRSVTFSSTAPAGVRTVSIVVTADGVPSAPGLVAVTVAALPAPSSAPGVIATTPVKLYASGGQPVVLDGTVTIVDVDSTGVTKATVTIGTGYANGVDVLNYSGPLTKTWDATTGTLTLTGAGTVADYQAALRSVTFSSTAPAGVKSVAIVVTADGVDSLPGAVAVTVAALPVSGNLPGVVATTPVKLYTSGGAPSVLDANVTLVDADSTTATAATVTIDAATYDAVRDRLQFADTATITGSWNAQTGVLTLTGTASLADYQAALRSVTFASDAVAGVRTVSIVVTANGVASAPGLVAVTIASLPVVTSAPGVVATTPVKLYTSGGSPVVLDATVTIVDVDSTGVTKATVTIGAGYANGVDVLNYSGPLTKSWDAATGTLTLTGAGTVTEYQAALRSVTFSSTAPAGLKTVSIVVTADGIDSVSGAVAVTVLALPTPSSAPGVVATTQVKLYTAGGTPVVLDGAVTIIDVDSTGVTKATVTIGAGYANGVDALNYSGPLTKSWDAATGTLTLTGAGTVADYQAALRAVTFASTAPAGLKTVSIVVTADGVDSVPGAVAVTVAALPVSGNVPSVVAATPVKLYTAGGSPVTLDANLVIVDADSTTATGATVRVDSPTYVQGADRLAFADSGSITGTWDAATGTLVLSGTASIADYQAALRSVTFASDALAGAKTVSIVLTANGIPSTPGVVAVTVASLPVPTSAPSVVATTPVKLYVSGGTPVTLDGAMTIIDADSTTATKATLTIGTGYANGADSLAYSGPLTSAWDAATGTLTLTGAATVAQYQAALRSVTFASTATAGVKTVTVVLTADGAASLPGVVTVTVASIPASGNVPSVVATSAVKLYTAGGSAIVLDPVLTVVDVDSTTVTSATVTLGGVGFDPARDVLAYTGTVPGIASQWNAATGTLTLTGAAGIADYQSALRSVTFASSSTALAGLRSATIAVVADGVASVPGVVAITVVALPPIVNVPPLVTTSLGRTYNAGTTAIALDPTLTVADLTSATMSGATVTIGTGRTAADTLAYTGSVAGIGASWDAATGTLTLSGSASAADYQAALRAVTFGTGSAATQGIRVVTVVVTDVQGAASLPGTVAVSVLANQTPLVVGSLLNAIPYVAGNDPVVLDRFVVVADDSSQIKGATVRITSGRQTGDALAFTAANGITGSYDAATGVLTLTGTATVEQYQQALRSVTFATTTSALLGLRTFTMDVTDQQNLTGTSLPFTASVIGNAAPLLSLSPSSLSISLAGSALPKTLDPQLTIADDSSKLTQATVKVTGGVLVGASDNLTVTIPAGSGITAAWSSSTRTLTLSGTASTADYQTALQSVKWDITGLVSLGTWTFTFATRDQQNVSSADAKMTITIVSVL